MKYIVSLSKKCCSHGKAEELMFSKLIRDGPFFLHKCNVFFAISSSLSFAFIFLAFHGLNLASECWRDLEIWREEERKDTCNYHHTHTLNIPYLIKTNTNTKRNKYLLKRHTNIWMPTKCERQNTERLGRKCWEVHTPLTPDWLASQYIGQSQNSARFPISIREIHITESEKSEEEKTTPLTLRADMANNCAIFGLCTKKTMAKTTSTVQSVY